MVDAKALPTAAKLVVNQHQYARRYLNENDDYGLDGDDYDDDDDDDDDADEDEDDDYDDDEGEEGYGEEGYDEEVAPSASSTAGVQPAPLANGEGVDEELAIAMAISLSMQN